MSLFYPITINSNDDEARVNSQKTHMSYNFRNPIILDKKYNWRLVPTYIHYPNTFDNISSTIGNNSLRYSINNGVDYFSITFPDGQYGNDSLSNAIYAGLIDNGQFYDKDGSGATGNFSYPFDLRFNNATNSSYFVVNTSVDAGWDAATTIIDLTNNSTSTFYELIGFAVANAVLNTGAKFYYSDNDPDYFGVSSTLYFQLSGIDISDQTNSPFKGTFFLGNWGIGGYLTVYDSQQLVSFHTTVFSNRINFMEVKIINEEGKLIELGGASKESNVLIRLTLIGEPIPWAR